MAGGGTLFGTVNGGNGGKGLAPGHAGSAGFNGASSSTPFTQIGSLAPGQTGVACTFTFTATFTPVDGTSSSNDGLYWHLSGAHTVTFQPGPVVTGQLGADGTYAQAIGVIPGLVLKGEFFTTQTSWDGRVANVAIGSGNAFVDLGGLFTFPLTASGIHFAGTLTLSATFAGSPPVGAPATYNVVMDAQ